MGAVIAVLVLLALGAILDLLARRADRQVVAEAKHRRPEGVQITHADGSQTLCELAFRGVDGDGFAVWDVASPFNPATDRLSVAMMPARSALSLPVPCTCGECGECNE